MTDIQARTVCAAVKGKLSISAQLSSQALGQPEDRRPLLLQRKCTFHMHRTSATQVTITRMCECLETIRPNGHKDRAVPQRRPACCLDGLGQLHLTNSGEMHQSECSPQAILYQYPPQYIPAEEHSSEKAERLHQANGYAHVQPTQLTASRPIGDIGVKNLATRLPKCVQSQPLEQLQL